MSMDHVLPTVQIVSMPILTSISAILPVLEATSEMESIISVWLSVLQDTLVILQADISVF